MEFWKTVENKIDCGVVGILVLIVVGQILMNSSVEFEEVSSILVLVRGIIQGYRVIRLLKQSRTVKEMRSLANVEFNLE